MAREYMSVRELAQEAGVSVQAVYKWIEKGELKAEVMRLSEFEKRYHIGRKEAARFLRRTSRAGGGQKAASGKERTSSAQHKPGKRKPRTGKELLEVLEKNGLIGMWADRDDIGDTLEFARKLRKMASTRHHD
jgi:AcrR family transcriptional regulator